MIKAAAFAATPLPAASPTATPNGAAVFSLTDSMVGALRVAASAATPRTTVAPDRHPFRGGINILNKLTAINRS